MMTKHDAEAIGVFVADMIRTANNETGYTYAFLIERLGKQVGGTPGSGACVCKQPPAYLHRMSELWATPFDKLDLGMTLDHRCAWHGQEAQPKLWGRHKTLELSVTPAQWLSLGVEYPAP